MIGKRGSVPVFKTGAEERAFRENHDSGGHHESGRDPCV